MSSKCGVTLVQSSVCSSPPLRRGFFCFVLFLVSCFLSPPCVLAGAHFCGFWPKGTFWSCQEGRRRGLANPRMNGAPSSPPLPHHSVKEPRGATSPGLCFPTSCIMSLPSATTSLSCLHQPCPHLVLQNRLLEAGSQVGTSPLEEQALQVLVPISVPGALAHVAHSAPGGGKPPHFRSVTGVPALDQSLGH